MTGSPQGSSDEPEAQRLPLMYRLVPVVWLLAAAGSLWAVAQEGDRRLAVGTVALTFALSAALYRALVARDTASRRRRAEMTTAIAAVTDPALTRLDADELVGELVIRTRNALAADVVGAAVLDTADGRLTTIEVRGGSGIEPVFHAPVGDGLLASVAENTEAVLANDTTAGDVTSALEGRSIRSFLGCPMLIDGRVLGVCFVTSPKPRAFSRDDLNLVQRVADRMGMALDRARLDVADRRGRDALAEGQARQRSLIEAAPLGIVELDVAGAVQRWNHAAKELLGWPDFAEEGVKAPVLRGEIASQVTELVRATRYGRKREATEVQIERQGAPAARLNLTGAPLLDADGHVAGVILVIGDVTEQRQYEQHVRQSQRLDAMARLAGGVAHDFNNLLTVIIGYSQFLLKQLPGDDPMRQDIEAIGNAGARASELTNQLLTIGRRQVVEPVVLDAQERVADLERIIGRLVGDDIELRVVTGTGVGNVRVDPHELEQVVMNLCINARDAMPNGGRLVVECRGIELDDDAAAAAAVPPGPYVLVTVADTGTGMTEEVREHCFDPFFTTKGRGKGTGLGLAAVYGVVNQNGGHIDVVSQSGRGTTFRLFFPMSEELVAESSMRRPTLGTDGVGGRTGRILLVEDEDAVRTLARAVLEDQGHEVVEFASAEEALALCRRVRRRFDVVVSDIVMPGMQGDALAREITDLWPETQVLLVSGYVERAASVSDERVSFLAKPFALNELADRVSELLPDSAPTSLRKSSASTKSPSSKSLGTGARASPRPKKPSVKSEPVAVATKKAVTKKVATKKVATKKVATKKVATKKVATKKGSAETEADQVSKR